MDAAAPVHRTSFAARVVANIHGALAHMDTSEVTTAGLARRRSHVSPRPDATPEVLVRPVRPFLVATGVMAVVAGLVAPTGEVGDVAVVPARRPDTAEGAVGDVLPRRPRGPVKAVVAYEDEREAIPDAVGPTLHPATVRPVPPARVRQTGAVAPGATPTADTPVAVTETAVPKGTMVGSHVGAVGREGLPLGVAARETVALVGDVTVADATTSGRPGTDACLDATVVRPPAFRKGVVADETGLGIAATLHVSPILPAPLAPAT